MTNEDRFECAVAALGRSSPRIGALAIGYLAHAVGRLYDAPLHDRALVADKIDDFVAVMHDGYADTLEDAVFGWVRHEMESGYQFVTTQDRLDWEDQRAALP